MFDAPLKCLVFDQLLYQCQALYYFMKQHSHCINAPLASLSSIAKTFKAEKLKTQHF